MTRVMADFQQHAERLQRQVAVLTVLNADQKAVLVELNDQLDHLRDDTPTLVTLLDRAPAGQVKDGNNTEPRSAVVEDQKQGPTQQNARLVSFLQKWHHPKSDINNINRSPPLPWPAPTEPRQTRSVTRLRALTATMPRAKVTDPSQSLAELVKSLNATIAGLHRQLQAEKEANTKRHPDRYPGSRGRGGKFRSAKDDDVDDEVVVPSATRIKREDRQTAARAAADYVSPQLASTESSGESSPASTSSGNSGQTVLSSDDDSDNDDNIVVRHVKRPRRSASEELREEVEGLDAGNITTGRRKRSRITPGLETRPLVERFRFKPVTGYCEADSDADPDKEEIMAFDSSADIVACTEFWDRLAVLHEKWEDAKGECWADEFLTSSDPALRCVSRKLEGERTYWHPWYPRGRFACRTCVKENQPCFTWTGEEFRLLPLHDDDRKYPVKKGLEIRYWLNVE